MIIAWIIGLLVKRGLSSVLATVIVYGGIGLVALIGGPLLWRHYVAEPYRQEGRIEIQTKWNAAVEAEKDRVAKAVAEAQAEAQKTIDELEKKEAELNAELDKARQEADADPVANDCGLGADGVQRLNRFR